MAQCYLFQGHQNALVQGQWDALVQGQTEDLGQGLKEFSQFLGSNHGHQSILNVFKMNARSIVIVNFILSCF